MLKFDHLPQSDGCSGSIAIQIMRSLVCLFLDSKQPDTTVTEDEMKRSSKRADFLVREYANNDDHLKFVKLAIEMEDKNPKVSLVEIFLKFLESFDSAWYLEHQGRFNF